MRLSVGALLLFLRQAASAESVADMGHVYLWDPGLAAVDEAATLDPVAVRLVLSQRLGVSRYHSLAGASDETMDRLNHFSRPTRLFSESAPANRAHALLWVENTENVNVVVPVSEPYAEFAISGPPPASANEQLVNDFIQQAESIPARPDSELRTQKSTRRMDGILSTLGQTYKCGDHLVALHVDRKSSQMSDGDLAESLAALLRLAKQEGSSITIVLMPPSTHTSRRSVDPYGSYLLPSDSTLRRRIDSTPSSSEPGFASSDNFSAGTQASPEASSTPVLGILPSCFQSLSACQRQTNNCSSHGSCSLTRKKRDKEPFDCFSCQCTPDVAKVGSGGQKTTYWAGPACQKRDIIVPFWLSVVSTVILLSLVGSGIGMLYSMGSEDLPSVIGAGVSGPARK